MDIRNTLSLAGGLLVLGAAGYYWGGFGRGDSPLMPADTSHLPDYEVVGIEGVQTDDRGQVTRRLSATRLLHYAQPERSQVEKPTVTLYQDGLPAWRVTAFQAQAFNNNRDLRLSQQVHGERLQGAPLTLDTESLNANQDQQTLDTPDTVLIRSPEGRISSTGLAANLREGALAFPAHVRGTYVVPPR